MYNDYRDIVLDALVRVKRLKRIEGILALASDVIKDLQEIDSDLEQLKELFDDLQDATPEDIINDSLAEM